MQVHPVSRAVVHVDFQRVSMQKRVRITVPIVLTGKPEGVKTQGGLLEHHLRDVEVDCLPTDIPEQVDVDVSALLVGQALHISDLQSPGVQFLGHPGTTVATVSLPAAERSHEEVAAEEAEPGEAAPEEGAEEAAAPKEEASSD
jgi:large subunit ribosomal protein L25